jgi:hypothetical protein
MCRLCGSLAGMPLGGLGLRGAKHGFERVADFGSPFPEPGAVAWLTDLLSVLEPEADL